MGTFAQTKLNVFSLSAAFCTLLVFFRTLGATISDDRRSTKIARVTTEKGLSVFESVDNSQSQSGEYCF